MCVYKSSITSVVREWCCTSMMDSRKTMTMLCGTVMLVTLLISSSASAGSSRQVHITSEYQHQHLDLDMESQSREPTELKLAHVVFRHGDRTPDVDEMNLYPDDPNIDNPFEPFGLKALTNQGKVRTYQVGRVLRERYKDFLNKYYIPAEIHVRTTDYDRTKMSALACLAGLYPPVEDQIWHNDIHWQPVPYDTLPFDDDDLMYYYTCARFEEGRTEMLLTDEFQKKIEPYKDLFEEMSFYTGRNLTTPEDIFYIDNLFQAEMNYNITLPEWAERLMPRIREMTVIEYELEFSTDELRRVSGGTMLSKMISDSYNKIKGTLDPQGRKLFLYSAHENNVAAILACSGVFHYHQPGYAATFILELHQTLYSNQYVFRIQYYKDVYGEPETLIIPGCEEFCPFEKFVELTKDVTTNNWKEDCKSNYNK